MTKSFQEPIGDFTTHDPLLPRGRPTRRNGLPQKVIEFEDGIRDDALESGAFFSADGAELKRRTGNVSSICYLHSELEDCRGLLFTHNHPHGLPFSADDIAIACEYDLCAIRAVTHSFRYIMHRPNSGWPFPENLKAEFEKGLRCTKDKVTSLVHSNEVSRQDAQAEHFHLAWQKCASVFGFRYERERS